MSIKSHLILCSFYMDTAEGDHPYNYGDKHQDNAHIVKWDGVGVCKKLPQDTAQLHNKNCETAKNLKYEEKMAPV